jgi:hypothetical protein
MDAPQVFLSYNSADREAVIAIRNLLRARDITTFLDRDNLVTGLPWPQALISEGVNAPSLGRDGMTIQLR